MKKLSGNKKIILLGIVLLIIAGIVVVALKGVKVSMMLQQHESISIHIGVKTSEKELKELLGEIFKDKHYILRMVEYFDDSVNICAESITNEEKTAIVQKINEKFGKEYDPNAITIQTVANVRVRDMLKPYVKPVIISAALIVVYMIIRFRKFNAFSLLGKIFAIIAVTEAVIFSVIAITRIPLSPLVINLMGVVAIVELIAYINKKETERA